MFSDVLWPRCLPTSPRRLGATTHMLTRRSGVRFQIAPYQDIQPSFMCTDCMRSFRIAAPLNLVLQRVFQKFPFQGLVYLREAGCNEGGAGCKYDSSCSPETWQVIPPQDQTTVSILQVQTLVFLLQVQTSVFIFLSGSHVALWPRTKVLWPRGKTAFVQLQLRSVL